MIKHFSNDSHSSVGRNCTLPEGTVRSKASVGNAFQILNMDHDCTLYRYFCLSFMNVIVNGITVET